jgi:uncharacterized protein YkwD
VHRPVGIALLCRAAPPLDTSKGRPNEAAPASGTVRRLSLLVLFLVLLTGGSAARLVPAVASPGCEVARLAPLDPIETAMLAELNAYRHSHGLPALTPAESLRRQSLWKAEARANGAPETHDDPGRRWQDRFRDCGYHQPGAIGENLAAFDGDIPPEEEARRVLAAWQASATHERVQTDPRFTAVGLARVRVPGTFKTYWTAAYGSLPDPQQ